VPGNLAHQAPQRVEKFARWLLFRPPDRQNRSHSWARAGSALDRESGPKDLDGLYHWFWDQYDGDDDDELADGTRNLHEVVDGDHFDKLMDGSITDLSKDEAALVGVDRDPKKAAGIYLVNSFDCELDSLAEILADRDDQTEQMCKDW